jgi:alpha-N-acetylglucosaminidase
VVWYNVLTKLGYTKDEINEFIAGPAFQGWWLMNNLEGWGGPNPDSWYKQRETLQKQILKRMREYGIRPVLPGYSGMVPHNAKERLGLNVSDPGLWCGYRRPAFLQPTDPRFNEIADLYYKEMSRLYGKADFYSMDPFHEGGNVAGVDLNAAGQAIWGAMKKANPKAVWVAQAWQANPRQKMIENLPAGDLIVLDLFAESRPQWGDPESTWYRKEGFGKHDWLYCMLLNYGGNVGLHGKMKHVIDEFYKAKTSSFGKTMKGVGMTMEGSENNPVMFELLCELPWRPARFDKDEWLKNYTVARYGKADKAVQDAWLLLSNTIYNCPAKNTQQGTHESVFCGRPDYDVYQVSSWSEMEPYYKPEDIIRAAGIMLSAADRFKGNNNFEYDLIDIVRQAVAEKGRLVYPIMIDAYKAGEKELFAASSQRFLDLILLQDKLLAARPEFKVGTWIEKARNLGTTPEEKDLYEWNARVQVTTWGNRVAADEGGLRDYAHKEWNGLLRDFYYNRWKVWIDRQKAQLNGAPVKAIDFYAIEEPWTKQTNPYSSQAEGDVIEVAKEVYAKITE